MVNENRIDWGSISSAVDLNNGLKKGFIGPHKFWHHCFIVIIDKNTGKWIFNHSSKAMERVSILNNIAIGVRAGDESILPAEWLGDKGFVKDEVYLEIKVFPLQPFELRTKKNYRDWGLDISLLPKLIDDIEFFDDEFKGLILSLTDKQKNERDFTLTNDYVELLKLLCPVFRDICIQTDIDIAIRYSNYASVILTKVFSIFGIENLGGLQSCRNIINVGTLTEPRYYLNRNCYCNANNIPYRSITPYTELKAMYKIITGKEIQ